MYEIYGDCIFHIFFNWLRACLMLLKYYIFGPISKICHEILFGYLTRLSLYYNYVSVTCNTGQSCDTWTKTCIHGFSHSVANFGSFLKIWYVSMIICKLRKDLFSIRNFFWVKLETLQYKDVIKNLMQKTSWKAKLRCNQPKMCRITCEI